MGTTTSSGGESGTDTDDEEAPVGCEFDDFPEAERDCGLLDSVLCASDPEAAGCHRDAVETCVLKAIVEGVTFDFIDVSQDPRSGAQREVSLHVLEGWRSQQSRTGVWDGCTTISDVTVHGAAALETCVDLDCVRVSLRDAPVVIECGAVVRCP